MKLRQIEGRPGPRKLRAGEVLRTTEEETVDLDFRKELTPELRTRIKETILGLVKVAERLREYMSSLQIINEALGEQLVQFSADEVVLIQNNLKRDRKNYSNVIKRQLIRERSSLSDIYIVDQAYYHDVFGQPGKPLLSDEGANHFLEEGKGGKISSSGLVTFLKIRPDLQVEIRRLAAENKLLEIVPLTREYQKPERQEMGGFVGDLAKFLLLNPDERSNFSLSPADVKQFRKILQDQTSPGIITGRFDLQQLQNYMILAAETAWIDEQGKIHIQLKRPALQSTPQLPERPM